ncbi:MAG TPA: M50 family metallopeptidase [Candidatus Eisenbacteria bacterium]|nr:M50 family metallopeptidase [Candidatus Eisenbacteria bacterium]
MGRQNSIRLFSYSGIEVRLHWFWFFAAVYEIQARAGLYSSIFWNILEYLALFLIVTLHEFGHALACRQVGGRANRILLWPFGGVAYVDPPPRPGATLWSIAAGPLVNVALLPILFIAVSAAKSAGWPSQLRDAFTLLLSVSQINLLLLVFNILPAYPLDGGQILRSLLWFVLGRARSLMVAAVFGLFGVGAFIVWAISKQNVWLGLIAIYMGMNCWGGFKHAQQLLQMAKMPRRNGYTCPTCNTAPPIGQYWRCSQCGQSFDTFETGAVCPNCKSQFPATQCLDCGRQHALPAWTSTSLAPHFSNT